MILYPWVTRTGLSAVRPHTTKVLSIHVTRKNRDFKRLHLGLTPCPREVGCVLIESNRPLYSNLFAPISRIMDPSTSTISVFVVTADIRSERRIDLHTTVGQLKVRGWSPRRPVYLTFCIMFEPLNLSTNIRPQIGKTGDSNRHSRSKPSDRALSQRGRFTADTNIR